MIRFVTGNVLASREQYIAQGVAVGSQEGLGTGLALKISKKWPDAQSAFKKYTRSSKFRGGDIWVCEPTTARPGIIYLATQPDMYHATHQFLRKAARRLASWADKSQSESVALPKIGAGLGKLSWSNEVKPTLVEALSGSACDFVVYETFRTEMEEGAP